MRPDQPEPAAELMFSVAADGRAAAMSADSYHRRARAAPPIRTTYSHSQQPATQSAHLWQYSNLGMRDEHFEHATSLPASVCI